MILRVFLILSIFFICFLISDTSCIDKIVTHMNYIQTLQSQQKDDKKTIHIKRYLNKRKEVKFHCIYIVLIYYVRIKTFQNCLLYCWFCISHALYLCYILAGSSRHRALDDYCQTVFEYKYSISCTSCNSSILV